MVLQKQKPKTKTKTTNNQRPLSMQEILKKIQRAKHKLSAFLKSIKPKKAYLRFRSTLTFQLQSNIR